MPYIDAYVMPIPTDRRAAFEAHSRAVSVVYKENGATDVMDAWGDDVPDGQVTSFPMAVKLEPGETVAFGWVVWPDKATRDSGMAAVMRDPRMSPEANPMPFDGKRLIYAGFAPLAAG